MEDARLVAQAYPNVERREVDIDAMAADIYTSPQKFGVILVSNMFGDILSNLAVALSGSLGLANPLGLVQSAALLLEWLGHCHENQAYINVAGAMMAAVDSTLSSAETRTSDLGGTANKTDVGRALVMALRANV
ncbi:isocitrate/isopropylmalate family dehydrogenase [Actibacterium mucosum]|nr:isocitrate/isopropylmalate family dehydrogenase [Actibacterium mucosum]